MASSTAARRTYWRGASETGSVRREGGLAASVFSFDQFCVVTGRIQPPNAHTDMIASGTSAAPQMKAGANEPEASMILGEEYGGQRRGDCHEGYDDPSQVASEHPCFLLHFASPLVAFPGEVGSMGGIPPRGPRLKAPPRPARRPLTSCRSPMLPRRRPIRGSAICLTANWCQSPIRGTRDNRRRRKDGSARVGRGALPRTTSSATAPPSRRGTRSGDRTRRVVPNATACALGLPRTEAPDQVEIIGIAP